mmetsp:Transcript_12729/g.32532  ORF Transcript_12729/g.32532 Transcript_12729/m.32532 type:complete len:117 (+) Transcript_12729:1454-1804(+)
MGAGASTVDVAGLEQLDQSAQKELESLQQELDNLRIDCAHLQYKASDDEISEVLMRLNQLGRPDTSAETNEQLELLPADARAELFFLQHELHTLRATKMAARACFRAGHSVCTSPK